MPAGIRTLDLRKIYNSAPPAAAIGGIAMLPFRSKPKRAGRPNIIALDGITLEIRAGEIFGLLGPNGAGKSTTVGVLTTRVRPTSGRAWVGPHEVWKEPVAAKRLIGVVPQRPNLDFALKAREILLFHGAYFGQGARERAERASKLLALFKLEDRAGDFVRGFSGGMMQRLSIARAMMHDPEVLFLDEPSAGLDPQTRLLLWDIVRDYNRGGKTVLLTTHNMEEADALCGRIAIIDHGRIIAIGTPEELKQSIPGGHVVRLKFRAPAPVLMEKMKEFAGVREVRPSDGLGADLYADRGGPLVAEIAAAAAAAGVDISDIHISEPSLETLFLHHTGRSLRD